MELLIEYIAPLMFVGLVFFLLSGFPISFALAATGFTFAVIGIGLGIYNPNSLQALPGRVWRPVGLTISTSTACMASSRTILLQ